MATLHLNGSISTVAVYLPSVLQRFTDSDSLIGLTLAAEGLFALTLPLVVGPLSDATRSPLGRRRPYLVAALAPLALSLAFLGALPSLPATAALLLLFFFAYYVYEPPYRSLYVDVLPSGVMGRAQSAAHVLRGLAIAGALVSGGIAPAAWRPLPFLVAAVVTAVAWCLCSAPRLGGGAARGTAERPAGAARGLRPRRQTQRHRATVRDREHRLGGDLRRNAHVCRALRRGGPRPVLAGRLGRTRDRDGRLPPRGGRPGPVRRQIGRVILVASVVYGLGLLGAGFATRWHDWYYPLILPVAIAGGAVMALAWGLLFKLLGDQDLGAAVELGIAARGLGLLIGPPLVGIMVDAFRPALVSTDGYGAVWPTVVVPILAVIPLVARLARLERDRATAPGPAR